MITPGALFGPSVLLSSLSPGQTFSLANGSTGAPEWWEFQSVSGSNVTCFRFSDAILYPLAGSTIVQAGVLQGVLAPSS